MTPTAIVSPRIIFRAMLQQMAAARMPDLDGQWDDAERSASVSPPPGFAAGMMFCIPALSTLGLLYSVLK